MGKDCKPVVKQQRSFSEVFLNKWDLNNFYDSSGSYGFLHALKLFTSVTIFNLIYIVPGDVMPKSLAKHVLRQRIYSCCLDFFCNDKMYPNRSGPALVEDVQVDSLFLNHTLFAFLL